MVQPLLLDEMPKEVWAQLTGSIRAVVSKCLDELGKRGRAEPQGPGGTSWAQGALQAGRLALGTPEAKLELLVPTARGLHDVKWGCFLA